MVQRITPTRLVEKRAVPTRAVAGRPSNGVSRVSTPTQRAKQQREREQIISNIKTSVKSFIGSISNMNELDSRLQSYYNTNVQNVPLDLQGDFKNYLQQERNTLIKSQNDLKARLQNSIKVYTKKEKYFSSIDKFAVADKYYAQLKKAKSLLGSLNSGNVLNASDSYSDITAVGRQAQREKEFRIASKISGVSRDISGKVSSYINKSISDRSLQSVVQIRDKFGVDLETAKDIRKLIQGELVKSESEAISHLRETRKQVEKFAKNVTDDYYIKYINTNASFPPTIRNARSIFLNEMTARQVSDFQQLNKSAQKIIVNYALLKNLKSTVFNNVATNRELVQIFTSRDIAQSKSKLSEIFNKRILNKDLGNINNLIKSNDKSLLKLAQSNNVRLVNTLNGFIVSVNNFIERKERVERYNLTDLRLLVRKAMNKVISEKEVARRLTVIIKSYPKGAGVLKEIQEKGFLKSFFSELNRNLQTIKAMPFKGRPDKFVRYSALNSILINLEDKIKKGKRLSTADYNFWKNSLNDLTGVKEFSKKEIAKLKKDFGKTGFNSIVKRVVIFKDVLKEGTRIAFNDLANLFVNTNTIMQILNGKKNIKDVKIDDITNGLVKFGMNIGKRLSDDSFEIGARLGSKLTKTQRDNIKLNTVEAIKKLYKIGITVDEFAKKIKENPELITLGIATGVVSLIKFNRKQLKKNPKQYFSNIASFFIDDVIFATALKVAKLSKRLFSPFVLRNIKVFEKGATKITSAQALKFIEGKKIDLFSASPNKIKELFKGADIGKSDLNKLIKDMLKNPNMYIGSNKKIKKIDSIIKTKVQRDILDFAKENNAILTGSASLKLQLKDFRKVGDFDLIVKNPKSFGTKLTKYLNDNTILGRITKYKRYSLRQNKKVKEVYFIYDNLTRRKIVDLDDFGLISKNFEFNLGRKLSKTDLIKINGVDILKVESQLPLKTSISIKTSASFRAEKELKDIALIVKKSKNKFSNSRFRTLKKLLDGNDNVLRVKGDIEGLGKDRKYFWVAKYGINPNKLSEQQIISKLKKYGLNTAMINRNIDLYSSDGFYFGIDKVYSYFLKGKKGTIVYVKDFKIDRYPKDIQKLLKKNLQGLLGSKEKLKLRKMLNRYIKNNPDKVLLGEKPLVDLIGEEEAIASIFSRLYPKKKLITREVYIPILDDFVKVQEAVIGKRPLSKIKGLYKKFSTKMKRGYKVSDMKKDITNWAKRNLDDFKAEVKRVVTGAKERKKFVEAQKKLLDDEIKAINKLDISSSEKKKLIGSLRTNTRRIIRNKTAEISKLLSRAREIYNFSRKRVVRVLKTNKKRIPARFLKKREIRKVRAPKKRVVVRKRVPKKRVVVRKPTPRKRVVPRKPTPRKRTVPRKPTPRVPTPRKPTPRVPIVKIPRIKKGWDDDILKDRVVLYEARFRERRNPNKSFNKKTNPIVTKKIRANTTKNRMINKVTKRVDNTLVKSMKITAISIGDRKVKDVSKSKILNKFRTKKSRNTPVLELVEKDKNALDTRGEKREFKVTRELKKKKRVVKSVVKKKTKQTNKASKKKTPTKRKKTTATKKTKRTKKTTKSKAKRKKTTSSRGKGKKKGKK